MANFLVGGTMISILHDICDIPGHLSKAFYTTTLKSAAAPTFLLCMALWFYFRLICLPLLIRDIILHYEFKTEGTLEFQPFVWASLAFLFALLCLHILWFIMMAKIAYKALIDKEEIE